MLHFLQRIADYPFFFSPPAVRQVEDAQTGTSGEASHSEGHAKNAEERSELPDEEFGSDESGRCPDPAAFCKGVAGLSGRESVLTVWVSSPVCMLGLGLKEEALELDDDDDQGSDLDRLNIICIKEEDPEDDDYLCKTARRFGGHSVTCPV